MKVERKRNTREKERKRKISENDISKEEKQFDIFFYAQSMHRRTRVITNI